MVELDYKVVEDIEQQLEDEILQRYRWGEMKFVIRGVLYERLLEAIYDSEEEEALMNTLDRMAGWCHPNYQL